MPTTTPTPSPQTNPLSEAAPDSLAELFSRDPFGLSRRERGVIVAELRRQREAWKAAEAAGATRAPRAPKSKTTLKDLGLD